MKKPAIFLGLTFLLSWPVAFLSFGSGMNLYTAGGLAMAVYFMFTPSISAVITQKLIYRQSLSSLRLSFRPNGWFLVALLLPATLAMASTATSFFFTGVSFTLDPTESSALLFPRQNLMREQLAALSHSAGELPIHPFFLVLLGGTIAGLTINWIAGFGEELGWRGLLLLANSRDFHGFPVFPRKQGNARPSCRRSDSPTSVSPRRG